MAKTFLLAADDYTVVDTETTGLDAGICELIEVAAIKVRGGVPVEHYATLIKPTSNIPPFITKLTGIDDAMVSGAPAASAAIAMLIDFVGEDCVVGHNIQFDMKFINSVSTTQLGCSFDPVLVDTLRIAKHVAKDAPCKKLAQLVEFYKLSPAQYPGADQVSAHRAEYDTAITLSLYECLKPRLIALYGENPEEGYRQRKGGSSNLNPYAGLPNPAEMKPTVGSIDDSNPFFGTQVCVTGELSSMTKAESWQCLVNLGAMPVKDLTKKNMPDYLLVGNKGFRGSPTSKKLKAEKWQEQGLPIEIISEDFFCSFVSTDMESALRDSRKHSANTAIEEGGASAHPLAGMCFVLSGIGKPELMNKLYEIGAVCRTRISGKTDYFAYGRNANEYKIGDARIAGIPVITFDTLKRKIAYSEAITEQDWVPLTPDNRSLEEVEAAAEYEGDIAGTATPPGALPARAVGFDLADCPYSVIDGMVKYRLVGSNLAKVVEDWQLVLTAFSVATSSAGLHSSFSTQDIERALFLVAEGDVFIDASPFRADGDFCLQTCTVTAESTPLLFNPNPERDYKAQVEIRYQSSGDISLMRFSLNDGFVWLQLGMAGQIGEPLTLDYVDEFSFVTRSVTCRKDSLQGICLDERPRRFAHIYEKPQCWTDPDNPSLAEAGILPGSGLNVLSKAGYTHLRDLVGINVRELKAVQGMGDGKIKKLIEHLARLGIAFPVQDADLCNWLSK